MDLKGIDSFCKIIKILFQIKYVSARDAGKYECQVSTVPKVSRWIDLVVVVPKVARLILDNFNFLSPKVRIFAAVLSRYINHTIYVS